MKVLAFGSFVVTKKPIGWLWRPCSQGLPWSLCFDRIRVLRSAVFSGIPPTDAVAHASAFEAVHVSIAFTQHRGPPMKHRIGHRLSNGSAVKLLKTWDMGRMIYTYFNPEFHRNPTHVPWKMMIFIWKMMISRRLHPTCSFSNRAMPRLHMSLHQKSASCGSEVEEIDEWLQISIGNPFNINLNWADGKSIEPIVFYTIVWNNTTHFPILKHLETSWTTEMLDADDALALAVRIIRGWIRLTSRRSKMEVSWVMGAPPNHHPFIDGIFPC